MYNPVEIGLRLKDWRQSQKLTQGVLAEKTDISQGFISDVERGRQYPSSAMIMRICEQFDLSADWLLKGEISYKTNNTLVIAPDAERPTSGDVRLADLDYSLIKRFRVKASAGGGLIPDPDQQGGAMAFPTAWLNANGINSQLAGMIEVKGDSMAPTIPDGAMVMVHLPEMFVERENIYAFTRDGAVYVKRIIPSSFDDAGKPQVLSLVSDNPAYKVEVVLGSDLNSLRIAGRVRCALISL